MHLQSLSNDEVSILLAFRKGSVQTNKLLADHTGFKRTKLQRLTDRMVAYSVLDAKLVNRDDGNNGKQLHFRLTDIGKNLLQQQTRKEEALERTEKVVEPRSSISEEIRTQSDKQPSLVPWLRSMAESFLAMADRLEQQA